MTSDTLSEYLKRTGLISCILNNTIKDAEQMAQTGTLSAEKLSGLNQVVATAERLIRARGSENAMEGVFEDADFSIVAGQDRHGHHGLTITWQSREVFRAWWRDSGWPARVELDEPGPWKAALLATPAHHA